MKITLSNMVCNRCVIVVESILKEMGFNDYNVEIGSIFLSNHLDEKQFFDLEHKLKNVGFEIVENRLKVVIQNIKDCVLQYLNCNDNRINLSVFITQHIYYEYSYLSDLFSKSENKTIEQYFIELRIDKAKEKLKYETITLSEIAYELGFSSPQHFTNQFKQQTGVTPTKFRKQFQ